VRPGHDLSRGHDLRPPVGRTRTAPTRRPTAPVERRCPRWRRRLWRSCPRPRNRARPWPSTISSVVSSSAGKPCSRSRGAASRGVGAPSGAWLPVTPAGKDGDQRAEGGMGPAGSLAALIRISGPHRRQPLDFRRDLPAPLGTID
jgi:hypothetical protein